MMSFSKNSETCKFCSSKPGVYTCPRCNAKYCSNECYKDREHEKCSEAFFQDWVMSSLCEVSDQSNQKKMLDILKKLSRDDENEDVELSIAERFADVSLNDLNERLIWERLSKDEQETFKKLLENENDLSRILPALKPWWTVAKVSAVKSESNANPEEERPPLPIEVKPISSLTSRAPSDHIKFNIINLLYSYIFLFRFYYGDMREFTEECVDYIFRLCPVLSESKNYSSLEESLHDSIRLISSTFSRVPMLEIKILYADICCIIKGPENASPQCYVLSALNDMKLLLLTLIRISKSVSGNTSKSNKKLLALSAKKIDYFISWVSEYYTSHLRPLADGLHLMLFPEITEEQCNEKIHFAKSEANDEIKKSKTLIEELN